MSMTAEAVLAELELLAGDPSDEKPSQELLDHGLIVWDGGSAKVGNDFEPVRPPAYQLTVAGCFALRAWRLPPP